MFAKWNNQELELVLSTKLLHNVIFELWLFKVDKRVGSAEDGSFLYHDWLCEFEALENCEPTETRGDYYSISEDVCCSSLLFGWFGQKETFSICHDKNPAANPTYVIPWTISHSHRSFRFLLREFRAPRQRWIKWFSSRQKAWNKKIMLIIFIVIVIFFIEGVNDRGLCSRSFIGSVLYLVAVTIVLEFAPCVYCIVQFSSVKFGIFCLTAIFLLRPDQI